MHGYSISQIRRVVLKMLVEHNIKARKFLDIGGGTGEFTKEIVRIVEINEVHIVDIDKDALKEARRRGFIVHHVDVSKEQIPFPDNYFDLVTAIEVMEHLIDPDHCISEVRRVLKFKGFFLITTPNLAWWVNRLALLMGYQPYFSEPSTRINVGKAFRKVAPYQASGHMRLFTLKALVELLRYYGFEIIDVKGAPGNHSDKLITMLDTLLSRQPQLSADIAILVRKS